MDSPKKWWVPKLQFGHNWVLKVRQGRLNMFRVLPGCEKLDFKILFTPRCLIITGSCLSLAFKIIMHKRIQQKKNVCILSYSFSCVEVVFLKHFDTPPQSISGHVKLIEYKYWIYPGKAIAKLFYIQILDNIITF